MLALESAIVSVVPCSRGPRKFAVGNASHHRPQAPIAIEKFGADEADSRKAEEKDYVDVGWLGDSFCGRDRRFVAFNSCINLDAKGSCCW